MKKGFNTKILVLLVVLMLLVGMTVGGTLAWLMTSTLSLENTFSAGSIGLEINEPNFDQIATNKTLKFIPGQYFDKDPTITVTAGSAPCYVRAFVVIWWDIKADPNFNAEDGKDWFVLPTQSDAYAPGYWTAGLELYDNTGKDENGIDQVLGIVFEYRWSQAVDARNANQILMPLFTGINVPGDLDMKQYESLEGFRVTVLAQAVQSEGIPDTDNDNSNMEEAFAEAGYPATDKLWNGQNLETVIQRLQAQENYNDNLQDNTESN